MAGTPRPSLGGTHELKVGSQRAAGAKGSPATICFTHSYRESVKLVEEARVACGGIGSEGLPRQIGQGLIAFAAGRERNKPVAPGDAAEILVDYRNRMVERIE
jgi:hypothetical protein